MAETSVKEKRPHFKPGEVIISPVMEADLISLSEGYYAAFPTGWFDKVEPLPIRASPTDQARRFATRMRPWLLEPHTRWTKATLSPTSPEFDPKNPNRVIGHAGWLGPERTKNETVNFWRKDASDILGWRKKMGWSEAEEEELWSGTDVQAYMETFLKWDRVREARMEGVGHWHLAPLWVIPEFQGRGVSSLLVRDVTVIADKENPPTPMYLEAMPAAVPIYRHFGYKEDTEGEGKGFVMVRYGPPKDEE